MGMFDSLFNRGERRRAAEVYEETLSYLRSAAAPDEVERARADARERAGEHLTDRDRQDVDARLMTRLSLDAARAYGDAITATPLDEIVDGTWRMRFEQAAREHGTWLQDEHRRDQLWQAAEAAMRRSLEEDRVDDDTVIAIDEFIAEVDPAGAHTLSDGWYRRFAFARLAAGHLSRPRRPARLITQAGERLVFTEEGTIVEVERFLDGGDRQRERVVVTPVQIDASDARIAVFADQLVFSTTWRAVVGVERGEDERGEWVRLDDAIDGVSHVVHTPRADLLAEVAREMVRRTA